MYIIYTITFFVSVFITRGILPRVIKFCYDRHIYDITNTRKVHSNDIPRLGGIIFFPSLLVAGSVGLILLSILSKEALSHISLSSTFLLIGAVFIYLVGIVDDLVELGARKKFLIQTISALIVPFCGLQINNFYGLFGIYTLSPCISYPITVFIVLLVVNAMNLIDGIDGLSSSLTIVALFLFTLLYNSLNISSYVIICLALMGSIIVFLYYNVFGKANEQNKIFMGDAGSLIIGYILAFFVIKYAMDSPKIMFRSNALIVAFSPIVIPVVDLIRVAFTRLIQGKGIFSPDKQHIHHLFMAKGISMHKTLFLIVLYQILICILNFVMCYFDININIIFIIDILLYILFVLFPGLPITHN